MRVRKNVNPFMDQHYLDTPDFSFDVYEFVTHHGRAPHSVYQAIEAVVPELTIFGRDTVLTEQVYVPKFVDWETDQQVLQELKLEKREQQGSYWVDRAVLMQDGHPTKQGWVNSVGFTSWYTDDPEQPPCLYVAICIHNQACHDPACKAGHANSNIHIVQGPKLAAWQMDAIKEEVGEHPNYQLGISPISDHHVLSGLAFTPLDAPLKGEDVGLGNLYRSIDSMARKAQVKGSYSEFISRTNMLCQHYELDMELVQSIVRARKLDVAVEV